MYIKMEIPPFPPLVDGLKGGGSLCVRGRGRCGEGKRVYTLLQS